MVFVRLLLCALLLAGSWSFALAEPKQSSSGETCIKTGTARKDGTDASSGQKMNCRWDTCTYCGTSGGKINCSILKTEYSNPTDCHPARAIIKDKSFGLKNRSMKMAPSP